MESNIVISLSGGMRGKTTVFNRLKRIMKKDDNIIFYPCISRKLLFGYKMSYRELFRNGAPGEFIQRIILNTYINTISGHSNKVIICDKFIMDIISLYQYFQFEFSDKYYISLSDFFEKNKIKVFTFLLRNAKHENIELTNFLLDILDSNGLPYTNHDYMIRRSEERLIQEIDKACFSLIKEINKLKK